MSELKILIVDDIDINRLLLTKICKKIENVVIQEAQDGLEAVNIASNWHPDIILMDIIMPNLNGIEAVKIIKKEAPNTIVLIISSLVDDATQEQVSEIGIQAFIHKPFDPNMILFKIMSFTLAIQGGNNALTVPSLQNVANIFSDKVRHFKTKFDIVNAESIMDFGTWLIARFSDERISIHKLDSLLEFFYQLENYELKHSGVFSSIIEENFDELYFTFEFQSTLQTDHPMLRNVMNLCVECQMRENFFYIKIPMHFCQKEIVHEMHHNDVKLKTVETIETVDTGTKKESRIVDKNEKDLLRQSFTQKTSAVDYVSDMGGDVIDEVLDLASMDNEWKNDLRMIEIEPTIANINEFVDNVLARYTSVINGMFEFTALAYALSSLGVSMKENGEKILEDTGSLRTMLMLMESLGEDLVSWREHVFELQDTADIHYLDSSFFSSCMQIEGIISNKHVAAEEDDDDSFELF